MNRKIFENVERFTQNEYIRIADMNKLGETALKGGDYDEL